jgi:ribosomal protein S12 methylthiotransferase accessory factor
LLEDPPASAYAHLGRRAKTAVDDGKHGAQLKEDLRMRLRHHAPSPTDDTLRKALRLVDEETGVIKLLYESPMAPDAPRIFGCGALCADQSQLGFPSHGKVSGSTSLVRDQAIAGAIGEAVERYSAAFVPYDVIRLSRYAAVEDGAIAPESIVLYDNEQLAKPDFPYHKPSRDDPIGWVNGYSLSRRRSILVPAFCVYQPYLSMTGEAPVIQQVTTGLACGNTPEEAILSGIYEVIERDAAMLMWMQSRRAPKVKIGAGAPAVVAETITRFGPLASFVTLLDVTSNVGIPSYVAVWDGPIGGDRGAIFASCANLNQGRAAVGALTELAQCLTWADSLIDRGAHLPDLDVDELTQIEEHVLWPLRPSNRRAFAFALSSEYEVEFGSRAEMDPSDLVVEIERCVELVAAAGLEVVVVDVTSPDIQACGLHVFRTIIPGAQPLYFGTGLHRVSERARTNPYPDRLDGTINLDPHPYP